MRPTPSLSRVGRPPPSPSGPTVLTRRSIRYRVVVVRPPSRACVAASPDCFVLWCAERSAAKLLV